MPIRNLTRKCTISNDAKLRCDAISKFIGLMFSRKSGRALIFKFDGEITVRLHMLFVFYPIDVLFLDKNRIVIDLKENFKPFAFRSSKRKAMYAVEVPNGAIKKTGTKIGDKISF